MDKLCIWSSRSACIGSLGAACSYWLKTHSTSPKKDAPKKTHPGCPDKLRDQIGEAGKTNFRALVPAGSGAQLTSGLGTGFVCKADGPIGLPKGNKKQWQRHAFDMWGGI